MELKQGEAKVSYDPNAPKKHRKDFRYKHDKFFDKYDEEGEEASLGEQ